MRFIVSVIIVPLVIGFTLSTTVVKAHADETRSELPAWIEHFSLKGDLRLRNEYIDNEPGTEKDRQRLRFRLGAKTRVNDKVKLGFGFATGSSDSPTSTNQTLEQEFQSKAIWLDYAYVKYFPYDELNLIGGKFKNPFFQTNMLWDSDIRFDGFAGQFKKNIFSETSLYVTGGFFPIDYRSTSSDINLYAGQVGTESTFTGFTQKTVKLKTGLAVYGFSQLEGVTKTSLAEEKVGNTYVGGALANDYVTINPTVKLYFKDVWGHRGVGFLGEFAHNVEAADDNNGWRAGAWLGQSKVKKPRHWKLLAQYTYLENDVFFDSFPDADLNFGGTNGKGWKMNFGYGLAKNVLFSLSYYNTESVTGSKTDQQLVQTDLIFKY